MSDLKPGWVKTRSEAIEICIGVQGVTCISEDVGCDAYISIGVYGNIKPAREV